MWKKVKKKKKKKKTKPHIKVVFILLLQNFEWFTSTDSEYQRPIQRWFVCFLLFFFFLLLFFFFVFFFFLFSYFSESHSKVFFVFILPLQKFYRLWISKIYTGLVDAGNVRPNFISRHLIKRNYFLSIRRLCLTFSTLWGNSADDKLMIIFLFSQIIGLTFHAKITWGKICMNCQPIFQVWKGMEDECKKTFQNIICKILNYKLEVKIESRKYKMYNCFQFILN